MNASKSPVALCAAAELCAAGATQAATGSRDARNEAVRQAEARRDADYMVAVGKCDALAGTAKDACVHDAGMRCGKS